MVRGKIAGIALGDDKIAKMTHCAGTVGDGYVMINCNVAKITHGDGNAGEGHVLMVMLQK